MHRALRIGAITIGAIVALGARCGDDPDADQGSLLDESSPYPAIDYTLTSENYRRWLATQDAMDSLGVDLPVQIDFRAATDEHLDEVVDAIKEDTLARPIIERAEWDVRDYVLTTVALAQSWDAASGSPSRVEGLPGENALFIRQNIDDSPAGRTASARIARRWEASRAYEKSGKGKAKGRGKGKGKKGKG